LFGSRKGAFTGAIANKKGLFEEAEGGTLFLDEVAELAPATQVKLLRFLQSREIRRVGDTETRTLDVRIIAATNKNVPEAVRKGEFREDLYYRLNTFHLCLPPLRERRVVIPSLVKYFVLKYSQENGKSIQRIHPAAQMALTSYDYPGNIRELENIIEHAVVLAENEEIRLEDLPDTARPDFAHTGVYLPPPSPANEFKANAAQLEHSVNTPATSSGEDFQSLAEVEKQHILHALAVLGHNQTEVAKKLGISRTTLWRKLQEHRIKLEE
jgi:DNA-binding NtrC family response regulator